MQGKNQKGYTAIKDILVESFAEIEKLRARTTAEQKKLVQNQENLRPTLIIEETSIQK